MRHMLDVSVALLENWGALALLGIAACLMLVPIILRLIRSSRHEGKHELDGKHISIAPIDKVLPRQPRSFLVFVVGLALGCWVLGFALSPSRKELLASSEWMVQPFYIASHFITLRMFINIYSHNFRAGVLHLNVPFAEAIREVRLILGAPGLLAALVIAAPFCVSDYNFLHSDRYAKLVKMGGDDVLRPIDYELWGVWCLEWFLNALMWVILVGFLFKNCSIIRMHAFRMPIDVVLREKQYKPFLQMSAQGATVVLGFSLCTLIYVLLTGGEITDYLGLAVTSSLLVVGFVPPWIMLNSKIDRAVRSAMTDLRKKLPQGMTVESWPDAHSVEGEVPLEHRLDEVLALLRLSHLENLYRTPGQSEARAIVVRLFAPAATVVWQLSLNWGVYLAKLERVLHVAIGRL
jgi:hypothetical protein